MGHMDRQPRVQVVLGEAERTDGLLRFVLEGEGFDIIGLASDDRELTRVLRGARPSVIVLDGGISATAAVEARRNSPGASLVVVWPDGVSAVVAEEHVEPDLVISDLGEAVRRADRRAELRKPQSPVPESLRLATTERPIRAPVHKPVRSTPSKRARTPRRGSRFLVVAATWMLVIIALATIAVAVPKAFDRAPRERAPRTSPGGTVDLRPSETPEAPERTGGGSRRSATCDTPAERSDGADRSAADRGDSCPSGRRGSTARSRETVGAVKTRPRVDPPVVGATEVPTKPPAVTPIIGKLEDVVDSVLTGRDSAGVVPLPGVDAISSSSAAGLSAVP